MAAMTHNCTGELELADRGYREALDVLEKAGAHWQATMAVHFLRHLLQVVGSSSDEIKTAERVLTMAQGVGDIRAQCWGQYDLASGLARAGDMAAAKYRMEQARRLLASAEQMVMTESIFLCTESYVLLQASEYADARLSAEKSWHICKSKFLFMEFNARSLPLLIESIAGPEWATAQATERRYLNRLCREARLLLLTHPNLRSPIHRARGRAFWTLGKRKKAIRCFESAIRCADRCHEPTGAADSQPNGRARRPGQGALRTSPPRVRWRCTRGVWRPARRGSRGWRTAPASSSPRQWHGSAPAHRRSRR